MGVTQFVISQFVISSPPNRKGIIQDIPFLMAPLFLRRLYQGVYCPKILELYDQFLYMADK